MTTPTNRHLAVTDRNGKHARDRVVYVQPKEERWREQPALYLCDEEAEPLLMSAEHVETIEALAAEMRAGVIDADNDKQEQRAIFQLLDVHVTLNHINKKRWASSVVQWEMVYQDIP